MMDYSYETRFESDPPQPPLGKGIRSMVFGILSIQLGVMPLFSIVGIVFAALARAWAGTVIMEFPDSGAASFSRAGRITGTVGLVVSIVFTALWAIVFFVAFFVFGVVMTALGLGGYYAG